MHILSIKAPLLLPLHLVCATALQLTSNDAMLYNMANVCPTLNLRLLRSRASETIWAGKHDPTVMTLSHRKWLVGECFSRHEKKRWLKSPVDRHCCPIMQCVTEIHSWQKVKSGSWWTAAAETVCHWSCWCLNEGKNCKWATVQPNSIKWWCQFEVSVDICQNTEEEAPVQMCTYRYF